MPIYKKLKWLIKRHPLLYKTRFKLLSKNSSVSSINGYSYNQFNSKADIPSIFFEVNNAIFVNGRPVSDLECIKQLGIWLQDHIKGGKGLSEPSGNALQLMLDGKGGVCSDVAQIFNNFCVINDVHVREWGTTKAPFDINYGGHSFNEVFCNDFNAWVMIDVYYCLLFYDDTDRPLSVLEMYNKNIDSKFKRCLPFNYSKPITEDNLRQNFYDGDTIPFLIHNYSNTYYDTYLKFFKPIFPVFFIHFLIFVFNRSYHYLFPLDDYRHIFYKINSD